MGIGWAPAVREDDNHQVLLYGLSGERPGPSARGWSTCPCRSNPCRPYLIRMGTCRLDLAFPYLLNLEWLNL